MLNIFIMAESSLDPYSSLLLTTHYALPHLLTPISRFRFPVAGLHRHRIIQYALLCHLTHVMFRFIQVITCISSLLIAK